MMAALAPEGLFLADPTGGRRQGPMSWALRAEGKMKGPGL